MLDPLARRDDEPEIIPARKLLATVAGTYVAAGDHFETAPCEGLDLTFEGIEGDFHRGWTRKSGSREPWYAHGTEMRNERQISIVSPAEMARVATAMGIGQVKPEWLGANLLVDGVEDLSMLPAGTLMFFRGGVTLKMDSQNGPCAIAGALVAERAGMADIDAGSKLFPKVARRMRGLLAWVEKPGRITPGEEISVRLPEQWIYRV